jgi:hypothetical protein
MIVRPPEPRLDGDTGLAGWRRWNGRLRRCQQRLLCDVIGDGQPRLAPAAQVIGNARDMLRPNPPRRLRAGTAGSGRGCYEATDRQGQQPPASRLGGKRRTRDRHEACSRWRAIGRLDVTSSRGGAIAEVASAVAERPRSRRRLVPLCLHCRACTRGDKRTPQQRTAHCYRGQQDRDQMAHAGCLRTTPSVRGGAVL